ncbi:MAG: hypothetical protein B0A82_09230 [Alkalinema sp. CACIAM 70d]|nr:MAG: hypothetical protein B0A82_09230 [Alkalinema sp. CACIAM 70d]
MQTLSDLIPDTEKEIIADMPMQGDQRHPAWHPLFNKASSSTNTLTNKAVAQVALQGNDIGWLNNLLPRCIDSNFEEAASALAELRAYGGLLSAGFKVTPIPVTSAPTADFQINAGDGEVVVEVFAKHQDEDQQKMLEDIAKGGTPEGVERNKYIKGGVQVETTTAVLQPGGKPDPNKANDSVQANMISRVCAAKGPEHQFAGDKPSILWIDFRSMGIWPDVISPDQAAPLMSWNDGITSGALWYAFYGWRGAPIFEEDFVFSERIYKMGHNGRYRLTGKSKSKLSGALISLPKATLLLENPWATHRLPEMCRRYCVQLPFFDLTRTIADWKAGDAERQIEVHKSAIDEIERIHQILNA